MGYGSSCGSGAGVCGPGWPVIEAKGVESGSGIVADSATDERAGGTVAKFVIGVNCGGGVKLWKPSAAT